MAHPIIFDDDDPLLDRVRGLAMSFPEAAEKISHGRPNFHTKKTFAIYGGGTKGGHNRFNQSLIVKADADELLGLRADGRFYEPAYWGPSGWIGLDLSTEDVDWTEVAELLDMSYRNTAATTLIRRLDADERAVDSAPCLIPPPQPPPGPSSSSTSARSTRS